MIRFILIFGLILCWCPNLLGQKITNVILVGSSGVTDDVKQAHSFILVKELPDSRFERYDYKLFGPLARLMTYKDTAMSILDGRYLEYFSSGYLRVYGKYSENLRTGQWYTYNETGENVLIEEYQDGTLLRSVDPRTRNKAEYLSFPDEKDAEFRGGPKAWKKYLVKKLTESKAADQSLKGGQVMVSFKIDINGSISEAFVSKSVEFVLDEEAVTVIRNSPPWEPAFQNGKNVYAYRKQPLMFVKDP